MAILSALVARANAGPYDDDDGDSAVRADREPGDREPRADRELRFRAGADDRIYVPITNAMVERVVTFAPPVAAVVDAAYRAAALAGDPTPGWRRRSRWSALIPLVSARAGQNQNWRDVDDPTISHGVGLDVRATWHVDHLLFDPNEPRIATLDVARRRERRRVASLAIELYFDWVTARAAADGDIRAELDAQQKAAELDAVTAGWFSQALAKRAELR